MNTWQKRSNWWRIPQPGPLQQDSLVGPRGRSALDLYRRIFDLSPANSEALAGIAAVRKRLVELAAKARDRGSLEDERELLEQSQGIERTAEVVDRLASIQSELARRKEEVERLEREEQIRALVSRAIKERSAGRLEEALRTYEDSQARRPQQYRDAPGHRHDQGTPARAR